MTTERDLPVEKQLELAKLKGESRELSRCTYAMADALGMPDPSACSWGDVLQEAASRPPEVAAEPGDDWLSQSRRTGLRVLTLPCGSTITASLITRVVRVPETADQHAYVIVGVDDGVITVDDCVQQFFSVATEAHRKWCGRG